MKIAIHHRKGSFSDRWIEYCKRINISYKIVNCYHNDIVEQLKDCDALMWHHHHGNTKDILVAKALMNSLEQTNKVIFPNFKTAWHFDDKIGQKYLLESLEAPIVPTYISYDSKEALEWADGTTFPKVFKLRGGAGANGMDIIDDIKSIQEAKQHSDFVFVVVHGGHEYYNLPSPRMQKQYRFYVDNGADLVVGHHTHCISGMETYKEKSIYYSLGNFLFTKPSRYDDWYKGIVLQIEINDKKEIKTKEIFVEQSNENFGVSLIEKDELKIIKKRFNGYSKMIDSKEELLKEWNEYTDVKKIQSKKWWSPLTFLNFRFFKALLIRTNILLFNKHGAKLYLNLIRCESHSDLSKELMKSTYQINNINISIT